jgi:hypothetical protein
VPLRWGSAGGAGSPAAVNPDRDQLRRDHDEGDDGRDGKVVKRWDVPISVLSGRQPMRLPHRRS